MAAPASSQGVPHVVVIGAGMGGLASAIRLAASGVRVSVLEARRAAGGKMRTLPSAAGPVDAGPTVLTMAWVFEDLFAAAGARLAERVRLIRQPLIARHWWPDGSRPLGCLRLAWIRSPAQGPGQSGGGPPPL